MDDEIIKSLAEIQKQHEWLTGQVYVLIKAVAERDQTKFDKIFHRLKCFVAENGPPNNKIQGELLPPQFLE